MFGALKKMESQATTTATRGSAAPGLFSMTEDFGRVEEISEKLNDAMRIASGQDKAAVDRKLGQVLAQLRGDLDKAVRLSENAAAGGEQTSPILSPVIGRGLTALAGDATA